MNIQANPLSKQSACTKKPDDPTPSQQPPEPRSFVDLPPEVRNMIYSHQLVNTLPLMRSIMHRHQQRTLAEPALTRTCHQLRSETLEMFYTMNTFAFGVGKGQLAPWAKQLGTKLTWVNSIEMGMHLAWNDGGPLDWQVASVWIRLSLDTASGQIIMASCSPELGSTECNCKIRDQIALLIERLETFGQSSPVKVLATLEYKLNALLDASERRYREVRNRHSFLVCATCQARRRYLTSEREAQLSSGRETRTRRRPGRKTSRYSSSWVTTLV